MTQPRQAISLGWPPEDPGRLVGFPRYELSPERHLWRIVRRGRGPPWWFGSTGAGRFDLSEPRGTCYLAADELSAMLEAVGPERMGGGISKSFFHRRRIRRLRVPRARSLADLTSRRCAGFGITLEVHTVVPYGRTRAWAESLCSTGVEGLLYSARHDPAGGEAVALFGKAGERKSWPPGRELAIEPQLIQRLKDDCGVEIVEVPRLSEVAIVEPRTRRAR